MIRDSLKEQTKRQRKVIKMKLPREMNTYCKKCREHTTHRVKNIHKGQETDLSQGNRRFNRRTSGYTAKIGEPVNPVKQSKKRRVMLECQECGNKQERNYPRSRKKIEIEK